jgi:predicted transcriptional regulator
LQTLTKALHESHWLIEHPKNTFLAQTIKVTASRDLSNLESKDILQKRQGGGRSTSYEIKLYSFSENIT